MRARPDLALGLATGRTVEHVYDRLAATGLDFSGCRSPNECIGVQAASEHSHRCDMGEHLFGRVNIAGANAHVPDGAAANLGAEAAHCARLIGEAGGSTRSSSGSARPDRSGSTNP